MRQQGRPEAEISANDNRDSELFERYAGLTQGFASASAPECAEDWRRCRRALEILERYGHDLINGEPVSQVMYEASIIALVPAHARRGAKFLPESHEIAEMIAEGLRDKPEEFLYHSGYYDRETLGTLMAVYAAYFREIEETTEFDSESFETHARIIDAPVLDYPKDLESAVSEAFDSALGEHFIETYEAAFARLDKWRIRHGLKGNHNDSIVALPIRALEQ